MSAVITCWSCDRPFAEAAGHGVCVCVDCFEAWSRGMTSRDAIKILSRKMKANRAAVGGRL